MNKLIVDHLTQLKGFKSENDAIAWLMSNFPAHDGELASVAIKLIPHFSWSRNGQRKLAEFYLPAGFPALVGQFVDCFASFMAIPRLCLILKNIAENDVEYSNVLAYHAIPVISRYCNSSRAVEALNNLTNDLNDLNELDH